MVPFKIYIKMFPKRKVYLYIVFTKPMFRKENFMQEIVSYIKKNLKKGYTKESLRWALINQGYSKIEVDKALKRADLELGKKAPQLETRPVIKHEIIEPKEYARTTIKPTTKKSFFRKLFKL
jgi:uncharacterized protein YpiB (UPF0302 family)